MRNKTNFTWIVLSTFLLAANDPAIAASLTTATQDQTASGFTVTQTEQAAQTNQDVVDSKNMLMEAAATFTTTTSTALPTAPANLKASVTSTNKVAMSWSASTGGTMGVQGYNVYRDSAYLATTANTAFTDQTVLLGKTYAYTVKAYDASNNKSLASNVVTVKVGTATTTTLTTATALTTTLLPAGSGMLFSPTSIWNTKLAASKAIHYNSTNLVKNLIYNTTLAAPWINTKGYTTTYYTVNSSTLKVPVAIVKNGVRLTWSKLYQDSMKGVPVPAGALASAGTDAQITIYDVTTDTLYEYWRFKKVDGKWQAAWGGILKNASTSAGIMPTVINSSGGKEYWGATATGLPVIAGTILPKELKAGVIPHALAFAIPYPKTTFVWPATRSDGSSTSPNAIPEGMRFRFPANIYIDPNWTPIMRMMVIAVRDYGMILRDKAGAATFYAQDWSTYSQNPYTPYYGGRASWNIMPQFPWSKLRAVA